MFIETHKDVDKVLAFIKSANVMAYPCGRRRSTFVQNDTNGDGTVGANEGTHIPFDPEARLNTEANNRKHSSLNGFTQTYIESWTTNTLTLSLAGYLFNIMLASDTERDIEKVVDDFGVKAAAALDAAKDDGKIYANILLEDVPLFRGSTQYNTSILRNQSDTADGGPSDCLDLPTMAGGTGLDKYYFSGLSFSTTPLTGKENVDLTRSCATSTVSRQNEESFTQYQVSLCILERVFEEVVENGETTTKEIWKIHQQALLPKIEHGKTEDSIKIGDITARTITQNGNPVPVITIEKVTTVKGDTEVEEYQLKISGVVGSN